MHLFKNSVSFIAILCVCGVAAAATTSSSRVGVSAATATATRRLSALSNVLRNPAVVPTSATSSTSTSSGYTTGTGALSDTECIDDYRDCMKSDNACGSEFEECTTKVLFHGHMGECYSTLRQCSATAIDALMGTSNLSLLSEHTTDSENPDDIIDYTYPKDGSIMGTDILGAATRNKLSTADCVKRYKRCLDRDDVCGSDFELCTSKTEFRKQAPLCDSVLSRCQKDGFLQLFGEGFPTKPSNKRLSQYEDDSNIDQWVKAGATLAAQNAVNTCYKVVDNCFLSACANNPYRCVEGVPFATIYTADFVKSDDATMTVTGAFYDENGDTLVQGNQTASDVRKFFRAACESTIGSNKYCQMTFLGRMPTKTELKPDNFVDLQEQIFDDAYATRNNKNILGEKINKLVEDFDTEAKNKCIDTFKTCTINSCGGGSGAACYAKVNGSNNSFRDSQNVNGVGSINGTATYDEIKMGCQAIVNTDVNCKYMAANTNSENGYQYSFSSGAFSKLFPEYTTSNAQRNSTIVVETLNGMLNSQYNAVAIENMKKQCQNVVANCVKSMCGKDYQNCYRNRNDISVATYDSRSDNFDLSMNRVGGILDFTIIRGLCASTVKNSDSCAESFAIAKAKIKDGDTDATAGWRTDDSTSALKTLSNTWNNSANTNYYQGMVQDKDEDGNLLCECENGIIDICEDQTNGVSGCSAPSMVSASASIEKNAVNTVFKEVLNLVEEEAQALYNAKLTHEQNVCLAQNSGSAISPDDKSYVWAKLTKKRSSLGGYETNGLQMGQSMESNDLYGSFCRVKVILKSSDKDIQTLLNGGSVSLDYLPGTGIAGIFNTDSKHSEKVSGDGNSTTAYFATGDAFTCGAWVPNETLDAMSKVVGDKARRDAGQGSTHDRNVRVWTTIGGAALGGIGSFAAMNSFQNKGSSLGGLLNNDNTKVQRLVSNADSCLTRYDAVMTSLSNAEKKCSKNDDNDCKVATDSLISSANGFRTLAMNVETTADTNGVYKAGSGKLNVAVFTRDDDFDDMKNNLSTLRQRCEDIKITAENQDNNGSKVGANWAAAGIGSVVTGVLANGIVSSAQKAKYEGAEKQAIQDWMDNIGSKIDCYVGGQRVGGFGDIITIDIED